MSESNPGQPKESKENPMVNLLINLIIPTVIMMKFSNDKYLGNVGGLLIALSFPLFYGLLDFFKNKKANFFSIIGLVNILLTGGIGLFKLDKNLMVVKETAIPLLFGLVIAGSEMMNKPLIKGFLSNILDLEKVHQAFIGLGKSDHFELKMKRSSYMLAGTFFLSAILNFYLAVTILKGEPGSEEFTASLGKMTVLSFPVITIPMTIMLVFILYYLFSGLKDADLTLEDVVKQ